MVVIVAGVVERDGLGLRRSSCLGDSTLKLGRRWGLLRRHLHLGDHDRHRGEPVGRLGGTGHVATKETKGSREKWDGVVQ